MKKIIIILLIIAIFFIFTSCKTTMEDIKETSTETKVIRNSTEETSVTEEKISGSIEDEGSVIPEIEGLYYDRETNIFCTLPDNKYGLEADVKVGIFLKDAFELNGVVENSICLISKIIKKLQDYNLYTSHEYQFPIPFDLVRTNSVIMTVEPIELDYDDPDNKDYYIDKYTHLDIRVPDNTLLYAPIETKITDEWNGCVIYNNKFEGYKDYTQNTIRLTLNSTDQLKYKEPDEILGANITINEINNCISSFAISPDDIKEYDNPNPVGPPWYKAETEMGTPLLLLNNEPVNDNNFPLNIKPCLEMFFNVHKVIFDEEMQWYKVIKNLETAENVFLEIEGIKVSIIPSDNFPSEEEIKNKNSKNNILISETEDTFDGIKINGLENLWRYNKWVYLDKEGNEIIAYWDEKDNKIVFSNNILRDRWQDLFIGLPLERVQELQDSKGWPPAFPFNPSKAVGFTAEVCNVQIYGAENERKNVTVIVFNLPPKTDIVASMVGALTWGGGNCSEEGCKTLHFGLNNELGRVEFSYILEEAIDGIEASEFIPGTYQEGELLFETMDNTNLKNNFSLFQTPKAGNLAMVMREPCSEFNCPLMSIDFNSFLKDEKGRIVYIEEDSGIDIESTPFIGIEIGDNTTDIAGVYIQSVAEEYPAAESGIKAGDIIVEIDGVEIKDPYQLLDQLLRKKVGNLVQLKIYRDEDYINVDVVLAEKPIE
jgi:hypothetical protein